jgi:hypothetical protein
LPARPRQTGARGSGLLGAALPKGVSRARYETALRKCGPGRLAGHVGSLRPANSPALRRGFAKFAACLRQNGVNIPPPNTSGKGPVFSAKGLNPNSPQFRAATAKCRAALISAFRQPAGTGASAGGSRPPTAPTQGGGSG